ncbi:MAG: fimbrillin family protein [Muribaculaceae bacterium]|nr:fimbrillin family protein [Muribaculaceae bacterium]
MKRRFSSIPIIIIFMILFGCSANEESWMDDEIRMPILPKATVNRLQAETAGVENLPLGEDIFRLSAFMSDDNAPTNWGVIAGNEGFENEPVNVTATSISTSTPKYYPPSSSPTPKLWFYAYAPSANATYNKGVGSVSPTVNYVLTGTQDIMIGRVTNGNGIGISNEQKQPEFKFSHLLKKLRFKLVQGEGFASNIDVTSIRIIKCHTQAALSLTSGALEFSGEPTGSLEITGTFAVMPEQDAAELPNRSLLCEPGENVELEVVAAGVSYKATVNLQSSDPNVTAGGAGVSHLVTLIFKGTLIESSSSITPWEDVGEASGIIK